MLKQVDLVLKKRDTGNLYASLPVKLNACLMNMADPFLANELHNRNIQPYSLFTYEMDNGIIFRLSMLHEQTAPLINACLNTKVFDVTGIPGGLEVVKTILYPEISIRDMQTAPPARAFHIQFASVTTYKREKTYKNWFALHPLLVSVSLKLKAFEGIELTEELLESAPCKTEILDYRLASQTFNIKRGHKIDGFIGEITISNSADPEQASALSLMLRYACYAGLGAKTALGMGGVVVTEV